MIKPLNLLIGLIFFLPFLATAQTNFQPALIVNAKGDTIKGKIDYSEWEFSPKSIVFQPDGGGATSKLTAADIKFFSVNVGHLEAFESYAGLISMDNTNVNRIGTGRDTTYRNDTVFLRVLQDGQRLKLFSYTDGIKARYFIAEGFSAQPKELVYRVYWNSQEANGERTAYETAYKGQLYDEAVKAGVMTPALKRQIQSTSYQADDLMKLAGKINNISADDVSKNNKAKSNPLRTAIIIIGALAVAIWVAHDFVGIHH